MDAAVRTPAGRRHRAAIVRFRLLVTSRQRAVMRWRARSRRLPGGLSRVGKFATAVRGELRFALSVRVLPARVAVFLSRARRRARRGGDDFSLESAARPTELAELLKLAGDRRRVVELGTGTGWSAIALALAQPTRKVI